MSWHNAPSVTAALAEATRRWPNRSRKSDGTIGDAAHAARQSDHNPDSRGIVHAFDLTHDAPHGVDCEVLSAGLVRVRDDRIKYIIWNRRICKASDWLWQRYTGQNPHTKHMHVSIKYTDQAEKDTSPWWSFAPAQPAPQPNQPGPQPSLPSSPPPPGHNRPVPPGYHPVRHASAQVVAKCLELLKQLIYPIGTQIIIDVGGKAYLFAIEWHKHAQTDHVPDNLKKWHRGVTVYER